MPGSPAVQRIARYRSSEAVHVGRLDGEAFRRLTAYPWEGGVETGISDPLARAELLPPVQPTKLVCVGLNYRAHIAESQSVVPGAAPPSEPILFLKPPSAVIAHGQAVRYPPGVRRLDPEAELGVVIARRARRIEEREAMAYVAGLVCVNDVSARDYQRADVQWTRGKGFDTFAPLGPWVATGLDPADLSVECRVNGQLRQRARTSDLLFPVPRLVTFITHIMTLEPGDVIATGTPSGVAPVSVGDRIEIEVEGVGVLSNPVEPWEAE